ncbi:hypothetical protein [Acidovorax sp. SUPP2539]|uniref:hypothetical protein n=1 Tax=Acidovorax sp. SUPP2539 TaxID=2920878 RepID=UPI0023DE1BE1|nr:hypothetical protein [Acidovorax sp. SUPP2539]GKS91196.1 hypothetical protein AVTE2539_17545 [Acidovorax sp. SUPP2539]
MRASDTLVSVRTHATGETRVDLVTAVCFGAAVEPLAPEDQERELRIRAHGQLMEAEMLAWERTGEFDAHGAASHHRAQMEALIKQRPEHVRARMAAERGLPHG